ncbi:hypothetical protein [Streptomyces vilmorinianum]|uniref:hypothetical protein n=1 Tax=Streptomyces vilmorinianum TaxID=3051092 RepID=UPI0010FB63D6|nr:hypothetical protein [Streptomyces vilmorinianum]
MSRTRPGAPASASPSASDAGRPGAGLTAPAPTRPSTALPSRPRPSRRRRGVTAQLLAVGRRAAGGRRDPRHAVQALCLTLAAVAAALLVWGAQVDRAVYGARDFRAAARLPVPAAPGATPAALWWEGSDTVGDRAFSVVAVEPLPGRVAAPPPGLPRWPEPGEAFVSPALLDILPAAATRFGRSAGTIAPSGLVDPGELFVYRHPPADAGIGGKPYSRLITGFGGAPLTGPSPFLSQGFDRAESDLYWLMFPLLGLPAAVLLVVGARLGARGRDRRLAVLHAIGAGRSVRARIAAGECLRPLAVGTLVAGLPLTVLAFTGFTLPVTGYEIAARDLTALRWSFPLSLLVVWAVLCLAFALLHLRIGPAAGARPRPVRDRPPAWPGRLCGIGTLCALWGAMIGDLPGVRLFTVGAILALAGLPPLLGRAAARLSVRLTGPRRGDAARLVGGRWAAAHPGVIARTCAALAVLLGLLAQVQVSISELTTEARHAAVLAAHLDGRLLQVNGASDRREADRFLAALAPGDRALRIVHSDRNARPVLVGECRDLVALAPVTVCPHGEPLPAAEVFAERTPRTEALRWMSFGEVDVRAAAGSDELREGAGAFVVLTQGADGTDRADGTAVADGAERIERAAYRAFPMPQVEVPGVEYGVGSAARARIADWVMLIAAAGFAFLTLTGSAGLLHAFLDRADELRPLAGYTSGVRFHLRVAWWGMGVPTICALVLATLFAGLLASFNLGFLAPSGDSPLGLLACGLALALAVCAAATLAGGVLAARFTHRWVPRGD